MQTVPIDIVRYVARQSFLLECRAKVPSRNYMWLLLGKMSALESIEPCIENMGLKNEISFYIDYFQRHNKYWS